MLDGGESAYVLFFQLRSMSICPLWITSEIKRRRRLILVMKGYVQKLYSIIGNEWISLEGKVNLAPCNLLSD